jgi:hypothetical protein
MKKEIRFPTLLGLLALLLGVAGGMYLIGSKQLLFLKANTSEEPVFMTLTNATDTSFTVSWLTKKVVIGVIAYGTDPNSMNQTAVDDREQGESNVSPYITHYVTVGRLRPLVPSTEYFFVVQSGSTVYDDNGRPYTAKTGPLLRGGLTGSDAISGKVVQSSGSPADGAIVYTVLPNVAPQSTIVTSSGNWIVPLTRARTTDLAGLAAYDREATIAEIFVQGGEVGETANASIVLTNARPAPIITLGQTYDWRVPLRPTEGGLTPTPTPSIGGSFSLTPLASPIESAREVIIVYPAADESVNTSRPSVLGTGPKGTTLSIVVESPALISGTTTVAADGSWEWNIPTDLAPGQHIITVTYTDALGQLKRAMKTFTVLAADSGIPAYVATPSGTTPSPSPILTPTPAPTPTLPPRISSPATGSGVPGSGNLTPTIGLTIMGLLILTSGLVPLLLNKNKRNI